MNQTKNAIETTMPAPNTQYTLSAPIPPPGRMNASQNTSRLTIPPRPAVSDIMLARDRLVFVWTTVVGIVGPNHVCGPTCLSVRPGRGKVSYILPAFFPRVLRDIERELGLDEVLAIEGSAVRISIEERRYGKSVTVLGGFDRGVDVPALAKDLKHFLGTGGTSKGDRIELQGDHRNRVKEFLKERGFEIEGA